MEESEATDAKMQNAERSQHLHISAVLDVNQCTVMVGRGKRRRELCNKPSKLPRSRRCGIHNRAQSTLVHTPTLQTSNVAYLSQIVHTQVDFDDEAYEDEEHSTMGGEAITTSKRNLQPQAANINELFYRQDISLEEDEESDEYELQSEDSTAMVRRFL